MSTINNYRPPVINTAIASENGLENDVKPTHVKTPAAGALSTTQSEVPKELARLVTEGQFISQDKLATAEMPEAEAIAILTDRKNSQHLQELDLNKIVKNQPTFFIDPNVGGVSTQQAKGMIPLEELFAQIMVGLDDNRKIANEQKAKSREASWSSRIKGADSTQKAGEERYKAALFSGICSIIGGAVSLASAGAGLAALRGNFYNNKGLFNLDKLIQKQTRYMEPFNMGSQAIRTTGDVGSGSWQKRISAEDALVKENNANAQTAKTRAEGAKTLGDKVFLDAILKTIETFAKLNDTKNQSTSTIIRQIV